MGIEEDRVELQGSPYERFMLEVKQGFRGTGRYVVDERGEYVSSATMPPEGTRYIEVLSGGEVREYVSGSSQYQRLRGGK